ncbi:hypothetical protein SB6425_00011 [Klebsiella huaxiensis]|nr:hypothetical protein SB6425_00011 [Klebsiella huaxiensis]
MATIIMDIPIQKKNKVKSRNRKRGIDNLFIPFICTIPIYIFKLIFSLELRGEYEASHQECYCQYIIGNI